MRVDFLCALVSWCSIPAAEDARGSLAGERSIIDDGLAVHQHAHDALGPDLPARLAAGHVAHQLLLAEADPGRVEQHDIGMVAAREEPAVLDAADHRRQVRDVSDPPLLPAELAG